LKMPAFEWVHVQLHQQKGMISLSPPTICNSAVYTSYTPGWTNKPLSSGIAWSTMAAEGEVSTTVTPPLRRP
ncbi:hypothetical protein, partial [Klebsiella pneumoniae]